MKINPNNVAVLAFIFLVSSWSSTLAADLPPALAKALKDYDRATIHNDTAALERLFADDYALVNSDSTVEDKRQAIADFRMPGFKIEPYELKQSVQKVWGDAAVISGLVNLRWTQDGKRQKRSIRIAHVWAKRQHHWQMTHTQVTRVPSVACSENIRRDQMSACAESISPTKRRR